MNYKLLKKCFYIILILFFTLISPLLFISDIYSAPDNTEADTNYSPIFNEPIIAENNSTGITATPGYSKTLALESILINGYSKILSWQSIDSVGVSYIDNWSNNNGDFLSLSVQFFLGFNSEYVNGEHKYHNFKSWDDYSKTIELHNTYLRFKFLFGRLYFLIGRYSLPYGLEISTNTHATLMQTLVSYDIHLHKDWGLFLFGQLDSLDYWFSITTGSGVWPQIKDKNFLLTFRIATPQKEQNFGLSLLYGHILKTKHSIIIDEHSIPTFRVVLDFKKLVNDFVFSVELMGGFQKTQSTDSHNFSDMDSKSIKWQLGLSHIFSYIPISLKNRLSINFNPRVIITNLKDIKNTSDFAFQLNIGWQVIQYLKLELDASITTKDFKKIYDWQIMLLGHIRGGI
jgi:hypothetical protein